MIEGKIIDRNFESIMDVSIYYNDSICLGKSDFSGNFQIEVPLSINKLSFEAVGFEQTDIELSDVCDYIELIMLEDANYDMSPSKADKVRKKEIKGLAKQHKEAYKKGIFKFPKPCYIQVFHKLYTKE